MPFRINNFNTQSDFLLSFNIYRVLFSIFYRELNYINLTAHNKTMPKKKNYSPEIYKKEIFELIKKEPYISTGRIAEKLKTGYDTMIKYLSELEKEGKISCRKIGKNRQWFNFV